MQGSHRQRVQQLQAQTQVMSSLYGLNMYTDHIYSTSMPLFIQQCCSLMNYDKNAVLMQCHTSMVSDSVRTF